VNSPALVNSSMIAMTATALFVAACSKAAEAEYPIANIRDSAGFRYGLKPRGPTVYWSSNARGHRCVGANPLSL